MVRKLENRFWEKVSRRDPESCWEWKGSKWGHGYGYMYYNRVRKSVPAHRVSYELNVGPIPEGHEIDHICLNKTCVNPAHLRCCTHAENSRNNPIRKNNTTGFVGVRKRNSGFTAQIQLLGKIRYLGTFPTAEQASHAYCQAAKELHGAFSPHSEMGELYDKILKAQHQLQTLQHEHKLLLNEQKLLYSDLCAIAKALDVEPEGFGVTGAGIAPSTILERIEELKRQTSYY